jgi:hypothetical protein
MKKVWILGGGTFSHVRNHMALAAPAFGTTAVELGVLCLDKFDKSEVNIVLTKMADPHNTMKVLDYEIVTNEDVEILVGDLKKDLDTKVIFFNAAICDFKGSVVDMSFRPTPSGKYEERLKTSGGNKVMILEPYDKVVKTVREGRKDIFLVAFKTTCGATEDEQYSAGLDMLKRNSCNLVLANDTKTRLNMIITPEEARYCVTEDRDQCLKELVEMAYLRSQLTFTRSSVVIGDIVRWGDSRIPYMLRLIVEWCIEKGAYKEFRGATVGHFACKLKENEFLTSIRKSNFNDISKNGMVRVVTDGPDTVLAYGAKPSVGGQSQRIVFNDHPEYDCILHFHCPLKADKVDDIPIVSQREYECGSHQCGENTSKGLGKFGNLSCVMLDNHGPNIVFHNSIDFSELTSFIERNFDLEKKTGGMVKNVEVTVTTETPLDKLKAKEHDKEGATV